MHKYEHVEDYIEVIAGLRDPNTLKPAGLGWFSPIINLARYDISVLNSMSEHTYNGGALTERQSELATKLVSKYRRQLAAIGIDSNIESRVSFRRPFRVLDERKDIELVEQEMHIRFPYNKEMIEDIKKFAEVSQGRCAWDRDNKVWKVALTEFNLNWALSWGTKNKFQIDPQCQILFEEICCVEKTEFSIRLTVEHGRLMLKNASESLQEYIKHNIGDLCESNLLALIDHSSLLCYQIDTSVYDLLDHDASNTMRKLMCEKQVIESQNDINTTIFAIKQYAVLVDRFPIFIYEPDLSNTLLDAARAHFHEDEIQIFGTKRTRNEGIRPDARVVHCLKPVTTHDIPLLISSAGLIAGGDRQMMLQRSQKVVYLTAGVYNNKNKVAVPYL